MGEREGGREGGRAYLRCGTVSGLSLFSIVIRPRNDREDSSRLRGPAS